MREGGSRDPAGGHSRRDEGPGEQGAGVGGAEAGGWRPTCPARGLGRKSRQEPRPVLPGPRLSRPAHQQRLDERVPSILLLVPAGRPPSPLPRPAPLCQPGHLRCLQLSDARPAAGPARSSRPSCDLCSGSSMLDSSCTEPAAPARPPSRPLCACHAASARDPPLSRVASAGSWRNAGNGPPGQTAAPASRPHRGVGRPTGVRPVPSLSLTGSVLRARTQWWAAPPECLAPVCSTTSGFSDAHGHLNCGDSFRTALLSPRLLPLKPLCTPKPGRPRHNVTFQGHPLPPGPSPPPAALRMPFTLVSRTCPQARLLHPTLRGPGTLRRATTHHGSAMLVPSPPPLGSDGHLLPLWPPRPWRGARPRLSVGDLRSSHVAGLRRILCPLWLGPLRGGKTPVLSSHRPEAGRGGDRAWDTETLSERTHLSPQQSGNPCFAVIEPLSFLPDH